MIKGFKYVFKNKYNIFSILTYIGALCEIAGEQPTYGTGGVRNTTAKQYGSTIYKFGEGMLTHLQLWVSLAFILFLFPLILITFCIYYIEKECLVLMCA